jgi:hypothetical protein
MLADPTGHRPRRCRKPAENWFSNTTENSKKEQRRQRVTS